jgi:hypothetical protein
VKKEAGCSSVAKRGGGGNDYVYGGFYFRKKVNRGNHILAFSER